MIVKTHMFLIITKNATKIYLIEFLYFIKYEKHTYTFKNNNCYDLRNENIYIYHNYHNIILKQYDNIEYFQGHFKNNGSSAFIIKNPYWENQTK